MITQCFQSSDVYVEKTMKYIGSKSVLKFLYIYIHQSLHMAWLLTFGALLLVVAMVSDDEAAEDQRMVSTFL